MSEPSKAFRNVAKSGAESLPNPAVFALRFEVHLVRTKSDKPIRAHKRVIADDQTIEIATFFGHEDARYLREELAKGAPIEQALLTSPFVIAAASFGFDYSGNKLSLNELKGNNRDAHYTGEFETRIRVVRTFAPPAR